MNIGGKYSWRYGDTDVKLIYVGKKGAWNQFVKIDNPDVVWCEVLDEELHMIEETKGN